MLTRIELYNLVWSKPVSKILEDYALSLTAFKNVCKENDIPLPLNGHWSKLKHNVQVEIIKLPNPSNNCLVSMDHYLSEKSDTPQARLYKLTKQLLKETSLDFCVADRLSKPDALIVEAKIGLEDFQKKRYFRNDGIISTLENQISISVAKENIPRSLRFMDALIKLIKKRGHSIKIDSSTKIIINNQEIEVRFREIMKRGQHPEYSWISKIPSGILSFRIDSHNTAEWRDSENRPLETRLVDILAKLELVSQDMEAYQIMLEKGWEEQRIRREIEEEIKGKREKELSDFKSLTNSSGRWHKSERLRNYLDAFEAKAKEKGTLVENILEWLLWARKKADWYDPFIERDDEMFKNIDRDTLLEIKRSWW
ncbi:hypothetical protein [Gelidibacter sp.]|uniref:hypothetical protein n=1 Tax=Gelidibacter sp. TaxID=2018083 RepID=UPI003263A271